MYIYEENIKLARLFYKSELAKVLIKQNDYGRIKKVIKGFYIDPDNYDEYGLIEKWKLTHPEMEDIRFSLDALCGWKLLFDLHEGEESWMEDYKVIRGSTRGHLMWPNRTCGKGNSTINRLRHAIFGDRVDYTLFDIKLYLDKKTRRYCRLNKAYQGKDTKRFLDSFTGESISNFAKEMNLSHFLKGDEIIDLSSKHEEDITLDKHQSFKYNVRWTNEEKQEHFSTYINRILEICNDSNSRFK